MSIRLIADSCCDVTAKMKQEWGICHAPLTVRVDRTDYVDDGTVDTETMLSHMATVKTGAASACPSPESYAALMKEADRSMVVTLSSKLSGSYQAACIARDMVLEEFPEKVIHVFDSESAAAGETRVLMLLADMIKNGVHFDKIVEKGEAFIRTMRTLFVVEDLSNFIKSGRLKKLPGMMASALSLCPVMSDNDHGEVTAVKKVRGVQKALAAMVDTVAEQTVGKAKASIEMVLTHVENETRAAEVKKRILETCPAIRAVEVVKAGALSAMYAARGGIIVAF